MRLGLVIDDSNVIRKVARRILESHDFEIEEAEDAQKGLEWCEREMPDLIIVDWDTPTLSGIAFVKTLRSKAGGTKPKIVYCATENDEEERMRAVKAGADLCMLKPFYREIIEEMLDDLGLWP